MVVKPYGQKSGLLIMLRFRVLPNFSQKSQYIMRKIVWESLNADFPNNGRCKKKIMWLSFQKTSVFTLLGQKKAFKVRFSPVKLLFIFLRFSSFWKSIYCGKNSFKWLFFIQNEGKWCFYKKKSNKKKISPPCFQEISIFCFLRDNLRHNYWDILIIMRKTYQPQVTEIRFSSVRRHRSCASVLDLRLKT